MKNDQYFKHDATAAYGGKLAGLLRAEGARGYGVYWFLLEAIRMQSDYSLSFSMLDDVVRKCHVRMVIVHRVVCDYGLFVIEGDRFFSPGLNKRLKNFERKVNAESSQSERKLNDKQLIISEKLPSHARKEEKRREEKKENCSSSKEKTAAAAVSAVACDDEKRVAATVTLIDSAPVRSPLPRCGWEALVDEMASEDSWMELTGMRSGLGELFVKNRGRIVMLFKEHIRQYAKEGDLLWHRDVKQYFANYMALGSRTCQLLRERLQKEAEAYCRSAPNRYETLIDGQRTYMGRIIPPDAPPRPGAAAVWAVEVGRWER